MVGPSGLGLAARADPTIPARSRAARGTPCPRHLAPQWGQGWVEAGKDCGPAGGVRIGPGCNMAAVLFLCGPCTLATRPPGAWDVLRAL